MTKSELQEAKDLVSRINNNCIKTNTEICLLGTMVKLLTHIEEQNKEINTISTNLNMAITIVNRFSD